MDAELVTSVAVQGSAHPTARRPSSTLRRCHDGCWLMGLSATFAAPVRRDRFVRRGHVRGWHARCLSRARSASGRLPLLDRPAQTFATVVPQVGKLILTNRAASHATGEASAACCSLVFCHRLAACAAGFGRCRRDLIVGASAVPTADAKSPGTRYCFHGLCHRVGTLAQTDTLVGWRGYLLASYYDSCRLDPLNPCGLTSFRRRFPSRSPR